MIILYCPSVIYEFDNPIIPSLLHIRVKTPSIYHVEKQLVKPKNCHLINQKHVGL